MKIRSCYIICSPGYKKKTGYYFRCNRDKEILNEVGINVLDIIVLNSALSFIKVLFFYFFKKDSLFVFENVATVFPAYLLNKISIFGITRNTLLIYHGSLEDLSAFRFYKIKRFIYERFEQFILKQNSWVFSVSNNMSSYLKNKYPTNNNIYTSPNVPSKSFIRNIVELKNNSRHALREKLCLPFERKIICYCGNSQAWQKCELLIDIINNNVDNNLFFLILTRDVDYFSSLIAKEKMPNVLIKTVDNDEVPCYLLASDFLYLIRDNTETNRFACPTKAVEYLYSGVPLIISDGVGDFSLIAKKYNLGVYIDECLFDDILAILKRINSYDYKCTINHSLIINNYSIDKQVDLFRMMKNA